MATEGRCLFHGSSGGSRMGIKCGFCQFDRAHTDCNGDTRHCRRLEFLKQYLMGREWMKVGTNMGKSKHHLGTNGNGKK